MAIDSKRNTTTVQPEIVNTKRRKKNDKASTPEQQFHETLMKCSKNNDLSTALSIYNSSASTGTPKLNPHHFNTLLHIFSNNATTTPIVNDAFRIFDHMVDSNIRPSEATITSMARIATSDDASGGDRAFELVKNMGEKYRLTPKIRTYDPALFAFCRRVEHAEKAYEVEKHMVASGLLLEEREIAALLQVSAQAGRFKNVYDYMLKLISCVDCVGVETAKIVETWFQSEVADKVGREDWNIEEVEEAILRNGGGWHGMGWFGKGKWNVRRSEVGSDGCCVCCGECLTCVDVRQIETVKFAESVAALAKEREVMSNFSDFQVQNLIPFF